MHLSWGLCLQRRLPRKSPRERQSCGFGTLYPLDNGQNWPDLQSTGSRHGGSVVVAHRLSCPVACGIFPDQESNPCLLPWQAAFSEWGEMELREASFPQNFKLIILALFQYHPSALCCYLVFCRFQASQTFFRKDELFLWLSVGVTGQQIANKLIQV